MGVLPVLGRGGAVLAITVALMPVVIRLVGTRLLDTPNERSSHTAVTPRGGGIGPAVAAIAVLSAWWDGSRGRLFAGLIASCLAFGLLGLSDDVSGLSAVIRLVGQVVIAAMSAVLLNAGVRDSELLRVILVLLAAGWLVAFVNAFNFMDGINGISAATASITGITWVALGLWHHAPALAVVGAVATGSGIGFLPFNFPRAHIFLGDVGSYFFGALLGVGSIIGLRAGLHPEAVFAPLTLYVADTGLTLVRRAVRGEHLLAAHRDHIYQLICQNGWSHGATTGLVAGLLTISGGLGLVAQGATGPRIAADAAVVAASAGYLLVPQHLARHRHVAAADL